MAVFIDCCPNSELVKGSMKQFPQRILRLLLLKRCTWPRALQRIFEKSMHRSDPSISRLFGMPIKNEEIPNTESQAKKRPQRKTEKRWNFF